jgi:hypothetical protein
VHRNQWFLGVQVKVSEGQRSVVFSLGDVDVVLNVGGRIASDGSPGAVTFAKRGPLLNKHDLALLARAMQLANHLQLRPALVRLLCVSTFSSSLPCFTPDRDRQQPNFPRWPWGGFASGIWALLVMF